MELKEFVDNYIEFEKSNKLFELEVENIYIWQFVRYYFSVDIYNLLSGTDLVLTGTHADIYSGKKSISDIYTQYIQRNIFFAKKRDVLIVSHTRKIKMNDGYWREPYTYWIDKNLEKSHYVLDYCSKTGTYVRQHSKNILTFDIEKYIHIFKKKRKEKNIRKKIFDQRIITPLEDCFDIVIPVTIKQAWLNRVNQIINMYPDYMRYFGYILKKIRPKIILISNAYSFENQILCKAAKGYGIPTVELAHGVATGAVLPYNYASKVEIETFPNYFFSFGEFDRNTNRWPIDIKNVYPVGFPELENNVRLYSKANKKINKKVILFLSSRKKTMIEFARELEKLLPITKYKILYKLHPTECEKWDTELQKLFIGSKIAVIKDYSNPVHYYLGMADWIIGLRSTALYEATEFRGNIAILEDEEMSASRVLYEEDMAIVVNSPEELAEKITNSNIVKRKKKSLFADNSLKRIEMLIDEIISKNSKNKKDYV